MQIKHTGVLLSTFTFTQITSCISQMQSNKSPGPAGYLVEFYKMFSTQLTPILLEVYNDSLEKGVVLPPILNQALISEASAK